MSEPFISKRSIRGLLIFTFIAASAVVVLIVIAFLGYSQFNQYQANALAAVSPSSLQVSLSGPVDGVPVSDQSPLMLTAKASSPGQIVLMELWVDGQLFEVQGVPSDAATSTYHSLFLWQPPAPGSYSLAARAENKDGLSEYSKPVVFSIPEGETQPGNDSDSPDDIDSAPGPVGGGVVSPPGAGDTVGPAQPVSNSVGNWVDSLIGGGNSGDQEQAPTAPALHLTANNCAAVLSIHDQSDNEQGFYVFRQSIGSPDWLNIATLDAKDNFDWITFNDENLNGKQTYYVASFNSAGENASVLASVEINPNDCQPKSDQQDIMTIALTGLFTELPVNKSYCYRSLGGSAWARWPDSGFFELNQDGRIANGQILTILLDQVDADTTRQPYQVELDCWGWAEDELISLGRLSPTNYDGENSGPVFLEGIGLSAELAYDLPISFGEPSPTSQYGGVGNLAKDPLTEFVYKLDPSMPYVIPKITFNFDECKNNLDQNQSDSLKEVTCQPYPAYAEQGLEQPYLVWYTSLACPGGANCRNYTEWLEYADNNGGTVGFDIYEKSSAGFFTHQNSWPWHMVHTIAPYDCDQTYTYSLRMWYNDGNETVYGPLSDPVNAPICPDEPGLAPVEAAENAPFVILEFSFDSFHMSEADDDDWGDPDDVEIYGQFYTIKFPFDEAGSTQLPVEYQSQWFETLGPGSSGTYTFLNIASWASQADECPDDYDAFVPDDPISYFCPHQISDGTYFLTDFYMCKSDKYESCVIETPGYTAETPILYNNNTLRIFVEEFDRVKVGVNYTDWDDASADDTLCSAVTSIGPYSVEQWGSIDNTTFVMESPGAGFDHVDYDANCTFTTTINVIGP